VHLEGLGRKRSTLPGYESFLRVHLAPFFGDRPLARIEPKDVEAFIAYQRDVDLVFCHPHTGRPLDRSGVVKRFKAALRRAGVREVRFHDLRHTFGTRMAAAGVPMRTLQEWMGHRNFKTTLIYADYMPPEREADLVDRAFARTGPERGPNWGPILSESALNQDEANRLDMGIRANWIPPALVVVQVVAGSSPVAHPS
jgi:hypothetical protein